MKILIVEDEAQLAEGLSALFRRSGYRADVRENGPDGLESSDREGTQFEVVL